MHPIVPLIALSWVIVLSLTALAITSQSACLGPLPYPDASPRLALAALCLAVGIEAFIRVLTRA